MSHDQQEQHYIVANTAARETLTNRAEILVKRFHVLEDVLLLWSIPALIGSLLLSATSVAVGGGIPFIAFVLDIVGTIVTLITACILLLKWIDTLQLQSREFAHTLDEKSMRRFLGVSAICLVLLTLIVTTAGGNGSLGVLQMVVFLLLGWHYRSLLKHFSKT